MKVLDSINNLEESKIKSMIYNGIDDKDGAIYQESESGVAFNIIRWINHKYTLNLQYLTYTEIENIITELMEASFNEEDVTISKALLQKRKYIDMKLVKGEPIFRYKVKDIKPSSESGTDLYKLSIKFTERVDLS